MFFIIKVSNDVTNDKVIFKYKHYYNGNKYVLYEINNFRSYCSYAIRCSHLC